MNKELRFLNYLENEIKTSKDWAINCLILFLPTFVVCCINFSKLLNFKVILTVVGIIAWVGIVCTTKHFKAKKCKKIVKEILKYFPLGEVIDKKIDPKNKDKFLYQKSQMYSKNGITKISIEHYEDKCYPWSILLFFHKGDGADVSVFDCRELSSIKKLRDFLLN